MTAVGRYLPPRLEDFFFQLSLWLGFGLAYQIARGIADQSPLEAIQNGITVIDAERAVNALVEVDIQRAVLHAGDWALEAVKPHAGSRSSLYSASRSSGSTSSGTTPSSTVRNWIFATNLLALVGYVLMPTAPPRMFPEHGFVDTLAQSSAVNHGSGLIELEPVRRHAERALGGRAHHRLRHGDARDEPLGRRPVDDVADLGLVLGHGDRQPLLARHRGRRGRRPRRRNDRRLGAGAAAVAVLPLPLRLPP